jgi:uncharacterized protein with HEPN domain
MSERLPGLLLGDILDSAGKIIAYTHGLSYDEFIQDSKTIDAVVRNFEIIGEAANRLPDDIKDSSPNINWHKIRGLRNRIVHNYFGIDYDIIWMTKEQFLPQLLIDIQHLLKRD